MPLTTEIEFNSHPDIEIIVSDGGGGSPKDHVVDILLTFDPYFMAYIDADPVPLYSNDLKGVCYWNDVVCAAAGKPFRLELERVRSGKTSIGVVAIDLENGESHPRNVVIAVPDDFKKAASLSKSAKKGRKKA